MRYIMGFLQYIKSVVEVVKVVDNSSLNRETKIPVRVDNYGSSKSLLKSVGSAGPLKIVAVGFITFFSYKFTYSFFICIFTI